jgi:hypothetical protein
VRLAPGPLLFALRKVRSRRKDRHGINEQHKRTPVTVGDANESKEVNLMHAKEKIEVFDRCGRDRRAQEQGREPPSMHREES